MAREIMSTEQPDSEQPDTTHPVGSVAAAWQDDRGYLLATASRILGPGADEAEDLVQEAFGRLAAQPDGEVRDTKGWLVVVVRRLALDRLGSAHRRLSTPSDPTESELDRAARAEVGAVSADPADRVTLDDEIRRALSVVLDRLTPGERAAFLLHDVFGLPFASVAELVGRTEAACRQLASRARQAVHAEDPIVASGEGAGGAGADPELIRLIDRFAAACTRGDVAGLAALMHPEVSGWTVRDGVSMEGGEVSGTASVSRQAARFFGPASPWILVPLPLDDGGAALVLRDGQPAGVVRFVTEGGLIRELHGVLL